MPDRFTQEAVRQGYARDYQEAVQLRERLRRMFPGPQSDETLLSLAIQLRSPDKE
ncbi:MAG: hypothetical protein ACI3XZ_06870 [Butyricicoccus sp.]